MPHTDRNRIRIRVRVRSFLDGRVLRRVNERQAREMCDEDATGDRIYAREPEAYRLSRKNGPLTDIRLLAPECGNHSTSAALTVADSENNAFAKAFNTLGGKEISIRALDRSVSKVEAWPDIHDDRAVVVCAGRVYGSSPRA